MIVLDVSALAEALVLDGPRAQWAGREIEATGQIAAPEHLRVETFSVIRGLALGRKVGEERARDAVDILNLMEFDFVPMTALASRMWELRANISAYDAAYVAAAELLRCPLVTADVKLARATGPECEFRCPEF